jgi:thioredoxin-related protein
VLLALYLLTTSFEAGIGGTRFIQGKWGVAAKIATENERPMMVFVSAPYCQFCTRMDEVFDQKEVGIFFNQRFVCKKLDTENPLQNFRASNWGISSVPTYVFLNADRQIIHKVSGYKSAKDIINEAKKALRKIEDENRKRLKDLYR